MRQASWALSWPAVIIILFGAMLQTVMLTQDVRFHPDEALYASYARRISLHGDLLLADVPLDKPPAGLALNGLSFSIFGISEFSARLPTFLVSLLELATFYALAKRLYPHHRRFGVTVTLFLALSPMHLAFAATAFHDPLLTLCLLLTAVCISGDRWGWAGVWAALAIATKQSAVQFVPIYVAIGLSHLITLPAHRAGIWLRLRRFILPILAMGLLLALWSIARAAPVDFWTLGILNPGQLRWIRADEVGPRLIRWSELLSSVTGFGPLLALAVIPVGVGLYCHSRAALTNLVVAMGVMLSLLAYWLLAYNTYDRYLYPLGPLILLLVAQGVVLLATSRRSISATLFPALAIVCITPFTLATLHGQQIVGGDRGANTSIDRLATTINNLPPGSVVYDYWLGWELGYYLGESTIQIIWQPSPQALARAICAHTSASYFAAPAPRSARWLLVLRDHGVSTELLQGGAFELFRLTCIHLPTLIF